ncbi:MAG: type II toxin-antitoxin system VapC family toxin [Gammaproteobacteria bacterium]
MARASESRLVYLDTHIVCWLYEGRGDLISEPAATAIERARLRVSPIVDMELQYLCEIGRLAKGPAVILPALAHELGLEVGIEPFAKVVIEARKLRWTRDPFDRLIVAETVLTKAALVTKDRSREHCPAAVW